MGNLIVSIKYTATNTLYCSDLKIEKRRKNLPIAEKIKILQNESPELLDLLDEFKEKANVVKALESIVQTIKQKNRENHTTARFLLFKYEALMNYMANVSFYFALKASESIDVRAHPVIQALFNLRQTLEKIDSLEQTLNIEEFVKSLHKEEVQVDTKTKELPPKVNAYTEESDMSDEDALSMDKEDTENEDDIIDRVQDIEEEFKSLKKLSKKRKRMASADDFGELDALDELDMEDKLTKKKSIRDYVAKIDSVSFSWFNSFHVIITVIDRNNSKIPTNIKVMSIYRIEIVLNKNVKVWCNLQMHLLIWTMLIGTRRIQPLLMLFVTVKQILIMNITIKSSQIKNH